MPEEIFLLPLALRTLTCSMLAPKRSAAVSSFLTGFSSFVVSMEAVLSSGAEAFDYSSTKFSWSSLMNLNV